MATPTQSSRGVQDPRKVFGFGKQTYSDYFGVPKGAAFDPSFSPAARESLLEDELITRKRDALQKDLAAQDEAETLLDEAPALNDRQLQRRLLENPRLMGTPQFKNLDEFLTRRQKVRKPNPKSDEVLAPLFAEKIFDPKKKAAFQQRTIDMGFERARDTYLQEEADEKQAIQLAEAGVPETEFNQLRRDGFLDPVSVARRVAQAKREQMAPRRSNNPLDQQIGLLQDAIRTRTSVLNATGEDPMADPELTNWNKMVNDLYGRRLKEFAPDGTPVVKPAAKPVVTPPGGVATGPQAPAAPVPLADLPTPEEARSFYEAQKKDQGAETKIASAWTQAKKTLESELIKKYPDRDEEYGNPAVLLASAIVSGKTYKDWSSPSASETGETLEIPYSLYALEQIKLQPDGEAFREPGNVRWGSQKVNNAEVIKAWAEGFLRDKGLLADPNAAPVVAPQSELQARADEIAKGYLDAK